MGKPRRDMPTIDFADPDVDEWVNDQIAKHPEIILDGMLSRDAVTQKGIEDILSGRLQVVARPGKPIQRGVKIDWDAWFLYYNLCLLAGFSTGYDDIAALVGRSPFTVKQKFIEIAYSLNFNT